MPGRLTPGKLRKLKMEWSPKAVQDFRRDFGLGPPNELAAPRVRDDDRLLGSSQDEHVVNDVLARVLAYELDFERRAVFRLMHVRKLGEQPLLARALRAGYLHLQRRVVRQLGA